MRNYNMTYMDLAIKMAENRVDTVTCSPDTDGSNYTTNFITMYDEVSDFMKRFSDQHLGRIVTPELYYYWLLGIVEIAEDYNCGILFKVENTSLNLTVKPVELKHKMDLAFEFKKDKKKNNNNKQNSQYHQKRLSDDDEKYLRDCCNHIDVEKIVKWVDKKMDEAFNKGYDAGADYYRNY